MNDIYTYHGFRPGPLHHALTLQGQPKSCRVQEAVAARLTALKPEHQEEERVTAAVLLSLRAEAHRNAAAADEVRLEQG